ncbi:hypothetical protein MKW98_013060 [Papaver atlanticum]|uniref:Hydroxyproline-rich glycoprotein family protein n=1 Tax=Papaver atlanticum TaxID=357466 RepID=A0AAD4SJQ6_9MAGN|nr:hypothetical protein MKW98_013060 [Papaver atlanticum]
MENQDIAVSSHHMDASRPSIGFPLGTALLIIVIFCLSGVFSCCYHWEKLRSLRQSFSSDAHDDLEANTPIKITPSYPSLKINQRESLPVLMPGDNIPKFIALPCPCEPPRALKTDAHVVDMDVKLSVSPTVIVYSHITRSGVHYEE